VKLLKEFQKKLNPLRIGDIAKSRFPRLAAIPHPFADVVFLRMPNDAAPSTRTNAKKTSMLPERTAALSP